MSQTTISLWLTRDICSVHFCALQSWGVSLKWKTLKKEKTLFILVKVRNSKVNSKLDRISFFSRLWNLQRGLITFKLFDHPRVFSMLEFLSFLPDEEGQCKKGRFATKRVLIKPVWEGIRRYKFYQFGSDNEWNYNAKYWRFARCNNSTFLVIKFFPILGESANKGKNVKEVSKSLICLTMWLLRVARFVRQGAADIELVN